MNSFKAAATLSFLASVSSVMAVPLSVGNSTASATATTLAGGVLCNPAHDYGNGVSCNPTVGLIYPSTTAAAKTTLAGGVFCNPAHDYGNGVSCNPTVGLIYPSTTPQATASTLAGGVLCNPAHDYGNGVSCNPTVGLIYPSTSAATSKATASTLAGGVYCNPAHDYGNGVSCNPTVGLIYPSTSSTAAVATTGCNVATVTVTVTAGTSSKATTSGPATSASSTAYACNPAHSYPNGVTCDGTALTLVTPTTAPAVSTGVATPSATSTATAGKCPLDLVAGTFEYPHRLEQNGVNGYFGKVDAKTNTTLVFDIPAADAGKNCNAYFSIPAKGTMETADYTLSKSDGAKIVFSGPNNSTASFEPEQNKKWLIYSAKCPAGQQMSFEMRMSSASLEWFQDYNPCALGMFVVVS